MIKTNPARSHRLSNDPKSGLITPFSLEPGNFGTGNFGTGNRERGTGNREQGKKNIEN
ncbi:MAG: hypothetical protein AB4426_18680 [Xenococcaceae cyanobacterium]